MPTSRYFNLHSSNISELNFIVEKLQKYLAPKISQFTVCSVHRYFFQFLRGHFCTATSIIYTEKFFYFYSSRPPMKISCLKKIIS